MKLPKAILFDLDDTLLSYDGGAEVAWRIACDAWLVESNAVVDCGTLLRELAAMRRWYWNDPERHRSGRLDLLSARTEIVRTNRDCPIDL